MKTLFAILLIVFSCTVSAQRLETTRGQPWQMVTIDSGPNLIGADGVRSLDVNGDGSPDFVAVYQQSAIVKIYLSNGSGGFTAVQVGNFTPGVEDAVFIDADGDGNYDVVSMAEEGSNQILIHWAPLDPAQYTNASAWTTTVLYIDGSGWRYAVPKDMNGDGRTDLVVVGSAPNGSVGWLEAPLNPRTSPWTYHRIDSVTRGMNLFVTDMDGDGDSDILISDFLGKDSGIKWYENQGDNVTFVKHKVTSKNTLYIDYADVDGDGVKEIVAPYVRNPEAGVGSGLVVFKRILGGWDGIQIEYPFNVAEAKSATVGDIDLDGFADIVLSAAHGYKKLKGVVWFRNDGRGIKNSSWQSYDIGGKAGTKFDPVLLLDMDGDGDLDVITTEEHDNGKGGNPGLGLIWYKNPTR